MTRGWGARRRRDRGLVVAADREGVRAAREARGREPTRGDGGHGARHGGRGAGAVARRARGEVWASGTARVARDLQRPRWRQATSTSQPVDSIKRNPIGARRSFTSSMNLRPPSVIAPREIVAPAQFVQRTTLGVATRARRASSGRDGERGVHADGGGRDAAEHGQRGAFARAARPLPRSAPRVSSARGCSRGTTDRGWSESARPPASPPPPPSLTPPNPPSLLRLPPSRRPRARLQFLYAKSQSDLLAATTLNPTPTTVPPPIAALAGNIGERHVLVFLGLPLVGKRTIALRLKRYLRFFHGARVKAFDIAKQRESDDGSARAPRRPPRNRAARSSSSASESFSNLPTSSPPSGTTTTERDRRPPGTSSKAARAVPAAARTMGRVASARATRINGIAPLDKHRKNVDPGRVAIVFSSDAPPPSTTTGPARARSGGGGSRRRWTRSRARARAGSGSRRSSSR